jgi:uncharacterized lipoprotein YmbA
MIRLLTVILAISLSGCATKTKVIDLTSGPVNPSGPAKVSSGQQHVFENTANFTTP